MVASWVAQARAFRVCVCPRAAAGGRRHALVAVPSATPTLPPPPHTHPLDRAPPPQASFEPLGLTIAVAKDRAIESLMQVGDMFVLNCLGEKRGAGRRE